MPDFYNWAPWNGLFAPRGTPRPILKRLNREVGRIMADPALLKQFGELGLSTNYKPVSETQTLGDQEMKILPPLIRAMKMKQKQRPEAARDVWQIQITERLT